MWSRRDATQSCQKIKHHLVEVVPKTFKKNFKKIGKTEAPEWGGIKNLHYLQAA